METYTYKDLLNPMNVLKGELGEIWLFDNTYKALRFKCYSEDKKLQKKILGWNGAELGASYIEETKTCVITKKEIRLGNLKTFDVIIPRRLLKRVCKLYNIVIKRHEEKFQKASERMLKLREEGKMRNRDFSKT